MKKILLLLSWLLVSTGTYADKGIDFASKPFIRAIEKEDLNGLSDLEELQFSDAVPTKNMHGKFFQTRNENRQSPVRYAYVGRVNSCRTGGCAAPGNITGEIGYEYFDYFILFDARGSILQTKVFNYQATHGQEITARGWLKQFDGYSGKNDLRVGHGIDAISGATISVYAITSDVKEKTQILQHFLSSQRSQQ
jgi:Na+-translocating ferredoxin:NAD+ oxidoreductase RnfG subunit